MPKLRHGGTDIAKFTQWLGRKCRNHNPLEELQIPQSRIAGAKLPNQYAAKSKGDLSMLADEEGVLLYTVGARTFQITVQEIDADIHENKQRIAVGF